MDEGGIVMALCACFARPVAVMLTGSDALCRRVVMSTGGLAKTHGRHVSSLGWPDISNRITILMRLWMVFFDMRNTSGSDVRVCPLERVEKV